MVRLYAAALAFNVRLVGDSNAAPVVGCVRATLTLDDATVMRALVVTRV
jgi:hypothetical protein